MEAIDNSSDNDSYSYVDDEELLDYFTTLNKSNRYGKLKFDNLESKIDKNRLTAIKKIDDLFVYSNHNKKLLVKLVINRKILDIVKILKNTEDTLTLQGKINLKVKEFSELENADVVIKIALDDDVCKYDLVSYSRRLEHEEKQICTKPYPLRIESSPDYLCKSMIIYKEKNLTMLKMFGKGKSLQQMVEKYPHKKSEFYREVLLLAHDIRELDYRFWKENTNPLKKSIYFNGKWYLVGTVDSSNYSNHFRDYYSENIAQLLVFFQAKDLPNAELRKVFENIFASKMLWSWQYKVLLNMEEKFFAKNDEKKLSRGFCNTTFPRRPRNRKKN